jgi:hypothetical protein
MYTMEKEPSYGMSSRALFLVFMAYERLVNGSGLLAPFRANIVGVFRKPTASGAHQDAQLSRELAPNRGGKVSSESGVGGDRGKHNGG